MATFIFDGTTNQTIEFDVEADQVVYELEASDLASFIDTPQGATLTTTSGVQLVFAGLALVDLENATFLPEGLVQVGSDLGETLTANADGSFITANGGSDALVGLQGDDVLVGNEGGDLINGGGGSDRLYGGMGDDEINVVKSDLNAGLDSTLVVGGLGADSITVGGFFTEDRYEGSITVFGGAETPGVGDDGDTIQVNIAGGTALVYGNGGDDTIEVNGDGAVSVFGGMGDDTIDVDGEGARQIVGGMGADTITVASSGAGAVSILGGNGVTDSDDGDDTILVGIGNTTVSLVEGEPVFGIDFGAGPSTSDFVVAGNGGDDTIVVGGTTTGSVFVHGGAGADDILINTLTDGGQVFGGVGADVITINQVASGADIVVTGGSGVSDTEDGADFISVSLADGVESTGPGTPEILTSATIVANAGDDEIFVSGGSAVENGSALATQASVIAGAGDDTIEVDGQVSVELTGGIGADTFRFLESSRDNDSSTEEADVKSITDMNFDEDIISFEAVGGPIDDTADLTDFAPTADQMADFDLIENADTVGDAASFALDFAASSGELEAGDHHVVAFDYDGEQYLAFGNAAEFEGGSEVFDIVKVTGFTGTIDNADFQTFGS